MMRKVMVMLWVVISLPIVIVMVLFEALTKVFMDKKEKRGLRNGKGQNISRKRNRCIKKL